MRRDCFCDSSCILFGDCCDDHYEACPFLYEGITTTAAGCTTTCSTSCPSDTTTHAISTISPGYDSCQKCLTDQFLKDNCPATKCEENGQKCQKFTLLTPKTCAECDEMGEDCILQLGHKKTCKKLQKKCEKGSCALDTVNDCSDCELLGIDCVKKLNLTKNCKKLGWHKKKGCKN